MVGAYAMPINRMNIDRNSMLLWATGCIPPSPMMNCYMVLTSSHLGWQETLLPLNILAIYPREFNVIPLDRIRSVVAERANAPFMAKIHISVETINAQEETLCFEVQWGDRWIRGMRRVGVVVVCEADLDMSTLRGVVNNYGDYLIMLPIYFLPIALCPMVGLIFGGRVAVGFLVAAYGMIFVGQVVGYGWVTSRRQAARQLEKERNSQTGDKQT
jgi:hypothetical protein